MSELDELREAVRKSLELIKEARDEMGLTDHALGHVAIANAEAVLVDALVRIEQRDKEGSE